MLTRTGCETVNFFRFFVILVRISPNFAHLLSQKFFFKKLILNISDVFMADEAPFIGNTPADPLAQAIAKVTVPKKS